MSGELVVWGGMTTSGNVSGMGGRGGDWPAECRRTRILSGEDDDDSFRQLARKKEVLCIPMRITTGAHDDMYDLCEDFL